MITEGTVRSTCGICFNNCGVLVELEDGRVTEIKGDPQCPINKGKLCPKGYASLEYLYHPDRLKRPLKRKAGKGEGRWQSLSWEEALGEISETFVEIQKQHGPESVVFIDGSAKGLQDAVFRRFVNAFGSPNIVSTDHICFVPRKAASVVTYGFYALPDYDYPPSAILVWAANLSDTRLGEHLEFKGALRKGAKLVVIDPRRTALAKRADLWLQPRPGSDLALALAMIHVIIAKGLYDEHFVQKWTIGFEDLAKHVQAYPPEKVAETTWIPAEKIREAAIIYATNTPSCIQLGNPIDHNRNSFQTARTVCILRSITGNLGRPGGELEQSSIQGLDYFSPRITLQDLVTDERWKRRVGTEHNHILPGAFTLPQSLVKAILEKNPYPIQAGYVQACNPLLTYSNAQRAYEAFRKLPYLVVADMFMTPTAMLADIVLPVASYLEFNSVVAPPYFPAAQVQQKVSQVGECRSDFEIINELAKRVGLGNLFWDREEQFLDAVLAPLGIDFEEFRKVGIITQPKQYRLYRKKGFPTPSGKVHLYGESLKQKGLDPLPSYRPIPESPDSDADLIAAYPFLFTTWKSSPYRHSGGRQIASLRGSHPEPQVLIHPETARPLGVEEGDWVHIETKRGRIRQRARLSEDIDPRVVGLDYGWWYPERGAKGNFGWDESNVNMLTDDEPPFSPEMGSSNLRGILCNIHKGSSET